MMNVVNVCTFPEVCVSDPVIGSIGTALRMDKVDFAVSKPVATNLR
jgi:hypothetical protein